MISSEILVQLEAILKRGNVAEIKQEKEKIVIIEIRRKAIYKSTLRQ